MTNEVWETVPKRLLTGVQDFADEMREKDIHVGMPVGAEHVVRCVTCGKVWPCGGGS